MDFKLTRHIMFILLFFSGCTKDIVLEDNPLDPGGSEYEMPIVTIINDIVQGGTIDTETITIELGGNELVVEYRLRLDQGEWSQWTDENSFLLEHLDEGLHSIYAQSRYVSTDTSEVMSLDFNVDAVSGPALMVFPRFQSADQGESIQVSIMAEEVADLAGLEINIEYDPEKVTITNVNEGSLFNDLGESIFFGDIVASEGLLTITSAVWGDTFTGTGPIAIIDLSIIESGNFTIYFDNDPIFRDQNNLEIQVEEIVSGLVLIN